MIAPCSDSRDFIDSGLTISTVWYSRSMFRCVFESDRCKANSLLAEKVKPGGRS